MKNLILTVLAALGLTAAICLIDYRGKHADLPNPMPQAVPAPKQALSAKEVEAYIRKQAVKETVFSGCTPALIYSRRSNSQIEEFCCVGSASGDGQKLQVLTAEHVFGLDKSGERSYRVEILNYPAQTQPLYFQSIFATGNSLSPNGDVVVIELGLEPVFFKQYSAYTMEDEIGDYGWVLPKVGDLEMRRVRSLLSGTYMEVAGYMKSKKTGAMYIIIDYHCISGESGTVFVDDEERTWVLHSGPDAAEEDKMRADRFNKKGLMIRGVTILSGPVGFTRTMK